MDELTKVSNSIRGKFLSSATYDVYTDDRDPHLTSLNLRVMRHCDMIIYRDDEHDGRLVVTIVRATAEDVLKMLGIDCQSPAKGPLPEAHPVKGEIPGGSVSNGVYKIHE